MSSDFNQLLGQKIIKANRIEDTIEFITLDFKTNLYNKYILQHHQDCCESVYIADINGDLKLLEGHIVAHAELSTKTPNSKENSDSLVLWSFYKIAAGNEWVDIRYNGSSNGYYSVSVSFDHIDLTPEDQVIIQKEMATKEKNYINGNLENIKEIDNTIFINKI